MCCEQPRSNQDACECRCNLGCLSPRRHFLSKEEKIKLLKTYKEQLEKELLGVEEVLNKMNE